MKITEKKLKRIIRNIIKEEEAKNIGKREPREENWKKKINEVRQRIHKM